MAPQQSPLSNMTQPPSFRESELRIFNANADMIRHALQKINAPKKEELHFKRAVLDVMPINPNKWIRVRTDGTKTTLAVKERITHSVDGTGEIEIEVSDFDKTLQLLQDLGGYSPRSIQENIREVYDVQGTEVSIDSWPLIAPIVEIEGQERAIYEVAEQLGIRKDQLTAKSVEEFYAETLGINLKTTSLTF